MPMLCMALTGCAILAACVESGNQSAEIQFTIADIPGNAHIEIANLQFYISEVALLDDAGNASKLQLTAREPWQSTDVALIDLSGSRLVNAAGERAGARSGNDTLIGVLEARDPQTFSGLRFDLGIPFELNHANPLTAAPPLNHMAMYWAWQTGHKFLRAELSEGGRAWAFHLGSTGCASASAIRPPSGECAQANRITVELTNFDPLAQGLQLELGQLIAAMRAADYAPCVGNYAHNPACEAPFELTGIASEDTAQRLFSAAR